MFDRHPSAQIYKTFDNNSNTIICKYATLTKSCSTCSNSLYFYEKKDQLSWQLELKLA